MAAVMERSRAFRVARDVTPDSLSRFAAGWIMGGVVGLRDIGNLRDDGRAQVLSLFRQAPWQVEMICLGGDVEVPKHVHENVDTIEVGLLGAVRLHVAGADPFRGVPDDRLTLFTYLRGIRINAGEIHGGYTLPGGAIFLSVQRWAAPIGSVVTDWTSV